MNNRTLGQLFLIPVGLSSPGDPASEWSDWLPARTRQITRNLRHFVVENAKTARLTLKTLGHPGPLRELDIRELGDTAEETLSALLAPALQGVDLGLMSEAGCPAIADPGAALVAAAHHLNVPVRPLVGPSALLLALMASGLDGQQFAFHGYLPVSDAERRAAITRLEQESTRQRQTQMFIETPYRNEVLLKALLSHCQPATRLCIASDISLPTEDIRTLTIANWRRAPLPALNKRPTVFLLLA